MGRPATAGGASGGRLGPTALLVAALLAAVALAGLLALSPARAQDSGAPRPVQLAELTGVIDPALADAVGRLIDEAEAAKVAAIVFTLDTPGGLDESMRTIIQAMLDSTVPVVVFVYPDGSRAASAGVYILMAADVAAMAPQTNLGAATPVSLTGEMDETMRRKVENDAAAYVRALAAEHGRNTEWVERAVRESVSLSATEALDQGVIDVVAEDPRSLLNQIDGITTQPKGFTLETAGAPIEEVGLSFVERLLHAVANPNVAFILMLLGIFGLIFELQSPGLGFAGIGGAISLLLALYAFQLLPLSWVGVAFIVMAIGLFVAETQIQSGGLLGIGGTVALVLGGLLLFDAPIPSLRVHWLVVALAALATLGFFMVVVRGVTRSRQPRPTTGEEGMVGAQGVARSELSPVGHVFVQGGLWRAQAEEGSIPEGTAVEVLSVEGLLLRVRRTHPTRPKELTP